jgi:hypothetical protein
MAAVVGTAAGVGRLKYWSVPKPCAYVRCFKSISYVLVCLGSNHVVGVSVTVAVTS